MKNLNLAVVGATGAVGTELLKVLQERQFPYTNLKLLASERSAGRVIEYNGKSYTVEATDENSFDGVDLALFAGGPASRAYGRIAQQKGCVVIDNSSTFRLEPDVPLIVPEVNPEALKNHRGLIANPNCSTILMVVALKPLHDAAKVKRVIVSTYQAVSGAGAGGPLELLDQMKAYTEGKPIENKVFQHQILFNVIPHIDVWMDEDYTKEEMKMVWETQKIFNDPDMAITATTVRVPVIRSHSESVYVETEKPLTAAEAKEIFKQGENLILMDDPQNNVYPMPIIASDTDEVYVGRVRKDLYAKNGLNFWIAADQIRKGAATNAVQIAELLLKEQLL